MNKGAMATVRSLVLACAGSIGQAAAVLFVAAVFGPMITARAATIETIYTFTGGADGSAPGNGLIAGPQDALYGASLTTVYQLLLGSNGKWTVTPIYATPNGPARSLASHGNSLYVALGNLYGKPCPQADLGCGEIVELTPPAKSGDPWTPTPVYAFKGDDDGVDPVGITVNSGAIFGVTFTGGNATACGSGNNIQTGCGTLFQIVKENGTWQESVLHAFKGGANDGEFPSATPSFDAAGNLYLTTNQGGPTSNSTDQIGSIGGYGIVSEVLKLIPIQTKKPKITTKILNFFKKIKSGAYPISTPSPYGAMFAPVLAGSQAAKSANELVATATGGGNSSLCPDLYNQGCGVVFQLTEPPDDKTPWTYTALHTFFGPPSDGAAPGGFLLQDGADTLYGITSAGGTVTTQCGPTGCGTIYKLTQSKSGWKWGGTVYKMPGGSSGGGPSGGLTLYKNKIVGVNNFGGSGCGQTGCGTIFVFNP